MLSHKMKLSATAVLLCTGMMVGVVTVGYAEDSDVQIIDLATYITQPNKSDVPETDQSVKNDSVNFPATRYPFTPKLLTSKDQSVCDPFLKGVQKYSIARHSGDYYRPYFGSGALSYGTFDVSGGAWLGDQVEVILVPAKGNQKAETILIKEQPGS